MRLFSSLPVFLLTLTCSLGTQSLQAQQVCPQPPVLPDTGESNIFTEQQETDLGDVLAEHITAVFPGDIAR